MKKTTEELLVLEFASRTELRAWLEQNHQTSKGIWIRLYKTNANISSVTFEDVLDEGLCFGWSESKRRRDDVHSYLQRFTPRRTRGTTSKRNLEHAGRLIQAGEMRPAGLKALGID